MLRAHPEGLGYREERARLLEENLASAWLVGNETLEAEIAEDDGEWPIAAIALARVNNP